MGVQLRFLQISTVSNFLSALCIVPCGTERNGYKMDIFCEYMVKHKKTAKDSLMVLGYVLAALFLSLIVFLFLFGRMMGLEVLLIAAVWYGAVFLIRKTNIEYEYILTNSILDIDKIMSQKTRKRVISIDFKQIDGCAPANANMAAGNANPSVKVLDLSGDINGKGVYYVDFSKDSTKYRVFFQPNAKILNNIKTVNPRVVTVSEEDVQ